FPSMIVDRPATLLFRVLRWWYAGLERRAPRQLNYLSSGNLRERSITAICFGGPQSLFVVFECILVVAFAQARVSGGQVLFGQALRRGGKKLLDPGVITTANERSVLRGWKNGQNVLVQQSLDFVSRVIEKTGIDKEGQVVERLLPIADLY